jgi:flagellin
MALTINHNMSAIKASRFLGSAYKSLSKSIERLSSGLRINTAGDDAAGLAMRELMRADIAAGYQGIRNAADGVSLIQTADGALSVIDAKLLRMKELAEQAATGTYSAAQVELLNSEYQAMAADIDRIANSTTFNGVKLLDGSINTLNNGQGIRIHFGTGNGLESDYYYISTQDTRATTATGLRVGGDGLNDIWSTGSYRGMNDGCCGGEIRNLSSAAVSARTRAFAYGYNWDGNEPVDNNLLGARYIAGRYGQSAGMTYERLVEEVNAGTQSRLRVDIEAPTVAVNLPQGTNETYFILCLGSSEAYYVGGSAYVNQNVLSGRAIKRRVSTNNSNIGASAFAKAINNTASSQFWAMLSGDTMWVFNKHGGNNNSIVAEERISSSTDYENMTFYNVETGEVTSSIGHFSLGGEHWGTMEATQQTAGGWALTLVGRDIGNQMDLHIAGDTDAKLNAMLSAAGIAIAAQRINMLAGTAFSELQNAADGPWDGAEIRTQEAAGRALSAIDAAILRKDQMRASLGMYQARLESVIEGQTMYLENLQTAESRISDVDVAAEMVEFTRSQVLAQAATAMLAQANSMSNLALTLILG